jgi:nicotinamidase-related amidase
MKKTALLVVDVQNGVMAKAHETKDVIENINVAVDKARFASVPVIWVQHESEGLEKDSEPWKLVSELKPLEDDLLLSKKFNSCFADTDLENQLRDMNVEALVLCGAATNWCIRATAYGALERGFDLVLVEDAHSTSSIELPDGRKLDAKQAILDLNIVMEYVGYPGRKNTSINVEDLNFDNLFKEDDES